MDVKMFSKMFMDKDFQNLQKMQYKYGRENISEMTEIIKENMFTEISLKDFSGNPIYFLENKAKISLDTAKILLASQAKDGYGIKAMEEEIHGTLEIENIASSRESIRKILSGYAPSDESENRILGMKRGLEFISNRENKITEENLHKLYMLTVGDYLDDEDKLLEGNFYRYDHVFVVGGKTEHEGISYKLLPEYMKKLIEFINDNESMNELLKAAAIHFYLAYLHPYFDGNGRTARFLQLWYLVQCGYSSAMFVPLSKFINEARSKYYNAYRLIEENEKINGIIDITPFLSFFVENVYSKLSTDTVETETLEKYKKALNEGLITEKEKELWNFVISAYGKNEFSTKQLEKDFGKAAYGTIRAFVVKFERFSLLKKQVYSNRPKYNVK